MNPRLELNTNLTTPIFSDGAHDDPRFSFTVLKGRHPYICPARVIMRQGLQGKFIFKRCNALLHLLRNVFPLYLLHALILPVLL